MNSVTAIDPSSYGLLKEIIDETYRDGIDSIDEAWAYEDGSIQVFATDEGTQLAVEIGEDINIFETGQDASFQASFAGGKPRNCQKGTACGGSCIAKGRTCSKKASAGQKEKAKAIAESAYRTPKQRLEDRLSSMSKPVFYTHGKDYKVAQKNKERKSQIKKSALRLPDDATQADYKKAMAKVKDETGGTGAKYEQAKAEYDSRIDKGRTSRKTALGRF